MSATTGDSPSVDFHNHILIGLGGTGGNTLREFRKELFQRHRDRGPQNVRLEYLYVDSSEDDLDNEDAWRVLGRSVRLPNDSRMLITVPNLRTMIDNAPQYPAISRWIGNPSIWRSYLDNLQGLRAAGGQRRRMGRLLMAANISRFNQQISQHYNQVTTGTGSGSSGNEGVTFHVICGLAGGTGSGAVIDVVMQLGKFIKERNAHKRDRVLIYALLPEENPVGGRLERYYFANGYAALLELNALGVGTFTPHDVADSQGRLLDPGRAVTYNGCYVFTNKTETGTVYGIDEMPGLLAAFLYQKIVAVGDAGKWSALVRQENSENGNSAPEPRVSEAAQGDTSAPAPERGVRFLTFGIKRVAVPEQEIREYLAFSFARQAILQLRFNQWTDSFGFIESPRNTDYAMYRSDGMLQAFRMTEDHLLLSRPILESDHSMQWKPIEEFWQIYLANIFEDVIRDSDKHYVVQELIAKGTEWFNTGYRNVGAETFYQRKLSTLAQEAREIVRLVEDHCFNDWLSGTVAMLDIAGSKDIEHPIKGILHTLRDELEEQQSRVLTGATHSDEKVRDIQLQLDGIEAEYAKIGALDVFHKRQRLQAEASRVLEELLIARTRSLGYRYAHRLCEAILRELEELAGQVKVCAAVLQNVLEVLDKGIGQRCQDQGLMDLGKGFVKFYDAENVRRITKRLVLDRDVQAAQTIVIRKAMRARMTAQRPTFRDMVELLNAQQLTQLLEQLCVEQSQHAHDALGLKTHEKLLGLSILDKIIAKYPTAEAKKQFAESVIPQASTLARIDLTEASNAAANPHTDDILRRSLSVLGAGLVAPSGSTLSPAVQELQNALRSAPKTSLQNFEFVDTDGQTSDLCFMSLTNLMPLRTVEHVAFLRRKYEELMSGGSVAPEDKLFVHIEDGGGYPGLYAPTMTDIRKQSRSVLLLASALNLLVDQADPRTGKRALVYTEADEFGVPVKVTPYGDNVIEACARMDGPALRNLETAVERRLKADEFVHQDQKKELVGRVARKMQEILPLCGNSPQHEDFVAFSDAYQRVRARLLPVSPASFN